MGPILTAVGFCSFVVLVVLAFLICLYLLFAGLRYFVIITDLIVTGQLFKLIKGYRVKIIKN